MKILIENDGTTISVNRTDGVFSPREISSLANMATVEQITLNAEKGIIPQMPVHKNTVIEKPGPVHMAAQKHEKMEIKQEDLVLAKIDCPNCSLEQNKKIPFFFNFIFCHDCGTKLALEHSGESSWDMDENGYQRYATRRYGESPTDNKKTHTERNESFESEETVSILKDVPDFDSTREEIEEWLDQKNIAHDGITQRNMLLKLATQAAIGMHRAPVED